MNGIMIVTVILTILTTWVLLVTYHYAYNRKWGNENSSVDALPEETFQHDQGNDNTSTRQDNPS